MTAGRTVNSLSQHWCTPHKYVALIKQFYGGKVDLDPCSNEYSIVNASVEYILPKDGLHESWDFHHIYVNPPYGSDKIRGTRIRQWLYKCDEAHRRYGSEVTALVPVATNTGHWKQFVWGKATAIAFLHDTRLKFLVDGRDSGKGAPMSCCIIYWGNRFARFFDVFAACGAVVDVRNLILARANDTQKVDQQSFSLPDV